MIPISHESEVQKVKLNVGGRKIGENNELQLAREPRWLMEAQLMAT